MEPDRAFAVFPNLPSEIRLMIWERALPGPRVIHLRQRKLKKTIGEWEVENDAEWPPHQEYDGSGDEDAFLDLSERSRYRGEQRADLGRVLGAYMYDDDGYKAGHLVGFYSEAQPPQILYVCREAFEVVSKFYQQAFSSLGSIPQTWINFDIDTLYLRHDTLSLYFRQYGAENVLLGLWYDAFRLLDMDTPRRVKKLAVLFDELDGYESLEEWVADLLRAFGNVEDLNLVLRHYQEDEDDQTCLTIMETPIDYEMTLTTYDNYDIYALKSDEFLYASLFSMPEVSWLDATTAKVNKTKLEEIRLQRIEDGSTWKMPSFDATVVLTARCRQRLEIAESKCESQIQQFRRERVALSAFGR